MKTKILADFQICINVPLRFISQLLDLNWTTAVSFLINLIMNHSKVELKVFNIKHV